MTIKNDASRQYCDAFTLVELLAIIGILAALTAILFPVFRAAQEKARLTSCAANLRQIGVALLCYGQDYDENQPQKMTTLPTGRIAVHVGPWAGQIYPYLKNAAIFHCPTDLDGAKMERKKTVAPVSYGLNFNLSGSS